MLFNSIAFLLFFPIVCVLYFAIPTARVRMRNMLLLMASYYFYMNWKPAYALLLLTSTVVTFMAALGMERCERKQTKILCLVGALVLNLSILFLFKYYNFLASNIETAMRASGMGIDLPEFGLLLPVGISFFTFQALGYSIDVYRGTTKVENDFPTYALFVSFFPQLVAGPIERSNNLLPQFKSQHRFDYGQAMAGIRLMAWGYFMKLALADRCGIYVDTIFNHIDKHNGGSFLVASLLFPFQIYGDFAGYSLIAIGAARVMGFKLMDNFRQPYFACSVGEFWHRWHISLSSWFKDYVYIPLGGNRVKRARLYFNLMVTFIISGIWHGANWTFLCWGTLHGVMLCIEKVLGIDKQHYKGFSKFCHWAVTFVLVCMAWVLFRADSLHDALEVITGIFTRFGLPYRESGTVLGVFMALSIMIVKDLCDDRHWKIQMSAPARWCLQNACIAMIIAYILLFGVLDSTQFIYFQF